MRCPDCNKKVLVGDSRKRKGYILRRYVCNDCMMGYSYCEISYETFKLYKRAYERLEAIQDLCND